MDPNDQPTQPIRQDDSPSTDRAVRPTGFRRTVLTAGMAAALLVAGGAAVVAAASPDPSASPTPAVSADPSDNGSSDASGSTMPGRRSRADCPDMDGQPGTPDATTTPTPSS